RGLDVVEVGAHERVHDGLAVPGRGLGVRERLESRAHRSDEGVARPVDDREVQVELRGEVAVQHRLGHERLVGDVVHRHVVVALGREQLLGDLEHLLALRVARHARAPHGLRGLGHGPIVAARVARPAGPDENMERCHGHEATWGLSTRTPRAESDRRGVGLSRSRRRVVRIPVLVAVVLACFAAGIGAGALTHQEDAAPSVVDDLAGTGLDLMTVSPTPLGDAPSSSPEDEGEKKPRKKKDKEPDPEEPDETGLSPADREAGILEAGTPRSASGELLRVPGESEAPGSGELVRVRVEVEDGLPVDGLRFAETVMTILNDPRGWGAEGTLTFA